MFCKISYPINILCIYYNIIVIFVNCKDWTMGENCHLLMNQEQISSLASIREQAKAHYMKFLSCLEEDQGEDQGHSQ